MLTLFRDKQHLMCVVVGRLTIYVITLAVFYNLGLPPWGYQDKNPSRNRKEAVLSSGTVKDDDDKFQLRVRKN